MSDDDKGSAELVAQLEEEAVELFAVVGVEAACGFVGENDRGAVDQGSGHGCTLAFAARQLRGAMGSTRRESEPVDKAACAVFSLMTSVAGDDGGEGNVFEESELGQKLMELKDEAYMLVSECREALVGKGKDIGRVVEDTSGIGGQECADDLKKSRFACAARADNRGNSRRNNVERYVAEHFELTEFFLYVSYLNHRADLNCEDKNNFTSCQRHTPNVKPLLSQNMLRAALPPPAGRVLEGGRYYIKCTPKAEGFWGAVWKVAAFVGLDYLITTFWTAEPCFKMKIPGLRSFNSSAEQPRRSIRP